MAEDPNIGPLWRISPRRTQAARGGNLGIIGGKWAIRSKKVPLNRIAIPGWWHILQRHPSNRWTLESGGIGLKKNLWALAALTVLICTFSAPALAQSNDNPPPLGTRIEKNNGPDVLGTRSATAPSALPFTGADLMLTVVAGLALIGTGVVLVRQYRLRRN